LGYNLLKHLTSPNIYTNQESTPRMTILRMLRALAEKSVTNMPSNDADVISFT